MNKFKFYFLALFSALVLFSSCHKDDDEAQVEALRDFLQQSNADMARIEKFIAENYIKVDGLDDSRITIEKVPSPNPDNLIPIVDDARVDSIAIPLHGITYKIYYIKLRTGNPDKQSPTRVDRVLASYDGSYLNSSADPVAFQYVQFPSQFVGLDETIRGWTEIFPFFKPGSIESVAGEPTVYSDFGAGVMFIPSGLAYFNQATSLIPSYVPLVFTFKLYDVKQSDQDGDGILSVNEDLNNDRDFTNDDTDGDGIQNYRDVDDDGDGFLTKNETLIPGSSPAAYYPFADVPSCNGDSASPDRVRKYLDASCH